MAYSYAEFERRFRGTSEDVRAEQQKYVRFFEDAPGPVVDLGCGRGEFVALLGEAGTAAYGIETNADMRAAGQEIDVRDEDVLAHLESLPDHSLGGAFMAHVIEHLPREAVLRCVALLGSKVAKGGTVVIETLNPQCVYAYGPFFMDLTHQWPIHPQTLQFLLEAHGFSGFEWVFREYLPEDMLNLPRPEAFPQPGLETAFYEAMGKLQIVLDTAFRHFIYAVVARY